MTIEALDASPVLAEPIESGEDLLSGACTTPSPNLRRAVACRSTTVTTATGPEPS